MIPDVSRWPAAVLIAFLVLAVVGSWPYGVFTLLRFVVCGSAVYLAIQADAQEKQRWTWLMGGTALPFNPIVPVYLTREIWQVLDLIVAGVFAVSLPALRSGVSVRRQRQR